MMKNWVDPEAKAEAERYENPIPSRTLILETIETLASGTVTCRLGRAFCDCRSKKVLMP